MNKSKSNHVKIYTESLGLCLQVASKTVANKLEDIECVLNLFAVNSIVGGIRGRRKLLQLRHFDF